MSVALFYVFAVVAILSAGAMVLAVRNTVAGALSLVVTMIALAGIYVLLDAYLIAALQILVYAGAIVVVFLFVIMLLNLDADPFARSRASRTKALGAVGTAALCAAFVQLVPHALPAAHPLPDGFGGYESVGRALYGDFVLPFEVTSFLLLAAIVGSVVLAKQRLD